MRQFVQRGRKNGSLMDKTNRARFRPVRSEENIAAVAQNVAEHPSTSTRHRSQELNISRTSLRRILHKDLGMRAYKVQILKIMTRTTFGFNRTGPLATQQTKRSTYCAAFLKIE